MTFTLRPLAVAIALTLSLPLALLVSTSSWSASSTSTITIPECPPVSRTATGNQSSAINATNNGRTWNLQGAVWSNVPDPIVFPIQSGSWTRGCIVGGTVDGNTPRAWTRDMWYNHEDGGNDRYDDAEGVRLDLTDTPNNFAVVRDVFVSDVEDAFDPNGGSITNATYLDRVHAEFIRDDCVENEKAVHNLYISDSLFDGCFVAFAEKPDSSSADAGTAAADFVLEDSLVYVQPQPLGPNYCNSSKVSQNRCQATDKSDVWLGSYGMFKWGKSAAANVVIRDTIFRVDLPSYSSCTGNRFPTNGTYENVTLVYTGPGTWATAGGCTNAVPKGVTVTTDKSVWDNAKAAWLDRSSTSPPQEPPAEEPLTEKPTADEPTLPDSGTTQPKPAVLRQKARVIKVTDGDTIKVRLASGARKDVRMIGIDTPTVYGGTDCGAPQASRSLKRLLPLQTRVVLVSDPTQDRVDRYGRILRYVMKNGEDINRAQVFRGWARVYVDNNNPFKRTASYRKAQRAAKAAPRGSWMVCR